MASLVTPCAVAPPLSAPAGHGITQSGANSDGNLMRLVAGPHAGLLSPAAVPTPGYFASSAALTGPPPPAAPPAAPPVPAAPAAAPCPAPPALPGAPPPATVSLDPPATPPPAVDPAALAPTWVVWLASSRARGRSTTIPTATTSTT